MNKLLLFNMGEDSFIIFKEESGEEKKVFQIRCEDCNEEEKICPWGFECRDMNKTCKLYHFTDAQVLEFRNNVISKNKNCGGNLYNPNQWIPSKLLSKIIKKCSDKNTTSTIEQPNIKNIKKSKDNKIDSSLDSPKTSNLSSNCSETSDEIQKYTNLKFKDLPNNVILFSLFLKIKDSSYYNIILHNIMEQVKDLHIEDSETYIMAEEISMRLKNNNPCR